MKPFLLRCCCFCLPALLAFIGIGWLADGYTDPFYLKLTSPRQNAMIIGISRAAHAIQPRIMNRMLQPAYPQLALYNFAFTLDSSPYGGVYLEAIRRKLQKGGPRGVFIVSADPWALANFAADRESEAHFRESDNFLATQWVSQYPNFPYLVNSYAEPYTHIISQKVNTGFLHRYPGYQVHEDGWLEVSVSMDSTAVANRVQNTAARYENTYLPQCSISPSRKNYLAQTIDLLKAYGDVYLVRIPVHPRLLAVEDRLYPGFSQYIDSLARRKNIPYFDFSDSCNRYAYVDGSHLWKASGARLSEALAKRILQCRQPR